MPNDDEGTTRTGPSEREVRSWVSDEVRRALDDRSERSDSGRGRRRESMPDLRTDKELEGYVDRLVRDAVEEIRRAEEAEGKTPPDSKPDEKHEPEGKPEETPPPWQERMRKFLWG